jgi:ribosomal protein S18 acetylase RimI-like enzyme
VQIGDPTIVEATSPTDLEDVRTLFLEYANSLGWDLSQGGRFADEIQNLPGPYAQPAGALLLARIGDCAAGVVGLQPVPEDARALGVGAEHFGELKRLYVRPEYRRHGVGRALMRQSEDAARARGYRSLVLTTSAEMMPLAQGLYDSLGYETTETYRNDMPYPNIRWLRLDL